MFSWTTAFYLFVSYVGIDALYAYWMLMVAQQRPVASAVTAAATMVLIVCATVAFTKSYLYAIPVALGSALGTYVTVRVVRNKKPD